LRAIGVKRLRAADTSIMPSLASGKTNAPVVTIAERCFDFILAGTQPTDPKGTWTPRYSVGKRMQ